MSGRARAKSAKGSTPTVLEHLLKTTITWSLPLAVFAVGATVAKRGTAWTKVSADGNKSPDSIELAQANKQVESMREVDVIDIRKLNSKYQGYSSSINDKVGGTDGGAQQQGAPEQQKQQAEPPSPPEAKKSVFVLSFRGDMSASQVDHLREEVTAVVLSARGGRDEVVLCLHSGGGTVTGYGLAAAQLDRLRAAGLRLTVCVDEVAASGGYMMACVGDTICAAPFAAVGSIGVVATVPNAAEWLKRHGVEVHEATAGEHKRTVTPYRPVTPADERKAKEDVAAVHALFKDFVGARRPALAAPEAMVAVATGEVWFGPQAVARGLVDSLATSDDVLLGHVRAGQDVFSVRHTQVRPGKLGPLAWLSDLQDGLPDGLGGLAAAAGLVSACGALGRALGSVEGGPQEFAGGLSAGSDWDSPERKYMLK
eukprot:CAMPEP_0171753560 /NCGR_PEP_ID=MMETSP0991-20121206/43291_1 /TAXON_ID=483369 /ORGANISM="non described non described, Strain CCMP2098" /LENGTH=425 /DNA_ID=CAMNT_0012355171 /DNA_START=145 /DNA_END=1422 /DNA_ORIENTATION=-